MSPLPSTIEILFFGDLVGKPGRLSIQHYLSELSVRPEVVIANVENVSHGFGIMERHYQELLSNGVDIMTGGNHIWDRREVFDFIESANRLVRPANLSKETPGVGARVITVQGIKIGIINLIGQSFMGNYNSPWEALDEHLPDLLNETPIVFLDFHAESTAEKIALARYASSLGVSAMVGTHTHVQTADERILNGRMGYLTDAGFNGAFESVIGMDPNAAIQRMRSYAPVRLEVANSEVIQVNAVQFTVEPQTGICHKVSRISHRFSSQALAALSGS